MKSQILPLALMGYPESRLASVAQLVLANMKRLDLRVCLLSGHVGAGKTALVRSLCDLLAVQDHVSSPSFNLINGYKRAGGGCIYHCDLYRLKHLDELIDLGLEEYVAKAGNYLFIEWAENFKKHLNLTALVVTIRSDTPSQRDYHIHSL